jgi:hypothetical protein
MRARSLLEDARVQLFFDPLAPVAGVLARVRDREHDELSRKDRVDDEVRMPPHLGVADLVRSLDM